MKKILILILSCTAFIHAQNDLKFVWVNHNRPASDNSLVSALNHFIADIKTKAPNFNYSGISYQPVDFMDCANLVRNATIGSMRAGNFISCNQELNDGLIPIFIVKKENQQLPYYSSYFIVHKNSNIQSLASDKIRKLYYVDEQSTSGYLAPLHKLWESGVIAQPSLKSAREKFGKDNVIKTGGHQEVIRMVCKDRDFNSIGLCGEAPGDNTAATILMRYAFLPQDVIFISQDLKQFQQPIMDWFRDRVKNGLFNNTSTRITGIEEYKLEHRAAYKDLENITKRVKESESETETRKYKYPDTDKPYQLLSFIKELKFVEIAGLISILVAIFFAGATTAIKFPKIIEILKK